MFEFIFIGVGCWFMFSFFKKISGADFKKLFKQFNKLDRISGENLTLKTKTCDLCGTKTVFIDGDNTSKLKMLNFVDPDNGNVVTRLICDDCYDKFNMLLKQNNKKNNVKFSSELSSLLNSFLKK